MLLHTIGRTLSHSLSRSLSNSYTIHRCILNCIVCTLFYIYCKQMPKHQFIQTLQMKCNSHALSIYFNSHYQSLYLSHTHTCNRYACVNVHVSLSPVLPFGCIHPHTKSSICGLNAIKFLCIHVNYIHNRRKPSTT